MDSIIVQVLRGFNLQCNSTIKDRGFFVCNTQKGIKMVKKVILSDERILFQHSVMENLIENGFTNIDRFCLSSENVPFLNYNNEKYIVTDYCDGKESSFIEQSQIKAIVKKVAEMHFICRDKNFDYAPSLSCELSENKILDEFKKYKKTIVKQKQYSDFDVVFLRNFDFYIHSIGEWHETLNSQVCKDLKEEAKNRHFICHNLLKEENIIFRNESVCITNFFELSVSHFILDLAALIKRYVKTQPEHIVPLEELISIYDSQNPIGKNELAFLHAQLVFPDKFIKLCEKYYAKKRTWAPASFQSRLESIDKLRVIESEYFKDFFN